MSAIANGGFVWDCSSVLNRFCGGFAFFLLPGFINTEDQGSPFSYRLDQLQSFLAEWRRLARRMRQKVVERLRIFSPDGAGNRR
jgi:hypothetical protein